MKPKSYGVTFLPILTAGALVSSGLIAAAQQGNGTEIDAELLEAGQQIYEQNCSVCHQADGSGTPPVFPALAGNQNLADSDLIVEIISHGAGAMPAFPNLSAEDIAAVATYIRNSWGNEFGGVTPDQVGEIRDRVEVDVGPQVSVWDGVFTEEQNERGREVHLRSCISCHAINLRGAHDPDFPQGPPIARAGFLRNWEGQSLAALFEYTRATMPQGNPGSLTDEEYIDSIAHMLAVSNMPAGESELTTNREALSAIVIEVEPSQD